MEDGGIRFLIRILRHLARKPRREAPDASPAAARPNPFLPYDPAMYVADASPTHVCLLNKFNVVERHLLIVTRAFEDQETPLTQPDFEALWTCLAEAEGLGFYNSGAVAGASQPHKHLQLVPLPLDPTASRCPSHRWSTQRESPATWSASTHFPSRTPSPRWMPTWPQVRNGRPP